MSRSAWPDEMAPASVTPCVYVCVCVCGCVRVKARGGRGEGGREGGGELQVAWLLGC